MDGTGCRLFGRCGYAPQLLGSAPSPVRNRSATEQRASRGHEKKKSMLALVFGDFKIKTLQMHIYTILSSRCAVDQGGELPRSHPEGLADGGEAQHHVELVSDPLDEEVVPSPCTELVHFYI